MDIANDINWKLDSTSKAKAKELRDRLAFMMDVTDIDAGLQKHYERLYKKVHGVNDPATLDEISPVELAEFVRDIFPAARNFPEEWGGAEIAKMRIVTARARQTRHVLRYSRRRPEELRPRRDGPSRRGLQEGERGARRD